MSDGVVQTGSISTTNGWIQNLSISTMPTFSSLMPLGYLIQKITVTGTNILPLTIPGVGILVGNGSPVTWWEAFPMGRGNAPTTDTWITNFNSPPGNSGTVTTVAVVSYYQLDPSQFSKFNSTFKLVGGTLTSTVDPQFTPDADVQPLVKSFTESGGSGTYNASGVVAEADPNGQNAWQVITPGASKSILKVAGMPTPTGDESDGSINFDDGTDQGIGLSISRSGIAEIYNNVGTLKTLTSPTNGTVQFQGTGDGGLNVSVPGNADTGSSPTLIHFDRNGNQTTSIINGSLDGTSIDNVASALATGLLGSSESAAATGTGVSSQATLAAQLQDAFKGDDGTVQNVALTANGAIVTSTTPGTFYNINGATGAWTKVADTGTGNYTVTASAGLSAVSTAFTLSGLSAPPTFDGTTGNLNVTTSAGTFALTTAGTLPSGSGAIFATIGGTDGPTVSIVSPSVGSPFAIVFRAPATAGSSNVLNVLDYRHPLTHTAGLGRGGSAPTPRLVAQRRHQNGARSGGRVGKGVAIIQDNAECQRGDPHQISSVVAGQIGPHRRRRRLQAGGRPG